MSLNIIQQPPETWYTHYKGKGHSFTVAVKLEGLKIDHDMPILVRLLYESGKEVPNQAILQIFKAPVMDAYTNVCLIKARVNDVSKNHQKQKFTLRIETLSENPSDANYRSVAPVHTVGIRSLSRIPVSKQHLKPDEVNEKKRSGGYFLDDIMAHSAKRARLDGSLDATNSLALQSWANDALDTILHIQWIVTGYETSDGVSVLAEDNDEDDANDDGVLPVYTCPVCIAVGTSKSTVTHLDDCKIRSLVRQFFIMKQMTAGPVASTVMGPDSTPNVTFETDNEHQDSFVGAPVIDDANDGNSPSVVDHVDGDIMI